MYWSAVLVALVPPGLVTVMSTVPAVPAGAVAVICEALTTVTLVGGGRAELDGGGASEAGPGDRDRRAPPVGPAVGATCVTVGLAV